LQTISRNATGRHGQVKKYNGTTETNTEIQLVSKNKYRNTTGKQGQIQKYNGSTGTIDVKNVLYAFYYFYKKRAF